ncbi:MAG: SUMF1/EgtB/PvdO family nonheme iron enzyme [Candidatus Tectomicrobia bacterium]|uniref:SUMF1/EgtB/PvdO family nonheme iron enzyme n=1 Tax=Tectimicrobiota bacterium TaxID=2528274 RepID=A0A932CMA3_UNCTE|nr:SUMF1/EgtB/PvdO family nonheme iron enzyme [Candidatus Tectomicrobia bacterium]
MVNKTLGSLAGVVLLVLFGMGLWSYLEAQEGKESARGEVKKSKTAVLEIRPWRISPTLTGNLTSSLREELARSGQRQVLSREQLGGLLKERKITIPEDCDNPRCWAELGKALGVDELVVGRAEELEETCSIILSLVNVSATREDSYVREYAASCAEKDFPTALKAAAAKLVSTPGGALSPLSGTILVDSTGPRPTSEGLAGMVLIPAGDFFMGSDEAANERPVHVTHLDAYYLDIYEVTNSQYSRFVEATNYRSEGHWQDEFRPGREDYPVVNVTWNDAQAYARWAGKRLPTEAEWEKAARGITKWTWPWGMIFVSRHTNSSESAVGRPLPVGSLEMGKSPYQIYDLAGNVAEWCTDWYDTDYYKKSPNANPKGPTTGKERVVRGGSFYHDKGKVRTSARLSMNPQSSSLNVGFRCARSATP